MKLDIKASMPERYRGYWKDQATLMKKNGLCNSLEDAKCLTRAIRSLGLKARVEKQSNGNYLVWKI